MLMRIAAYCRVSTDKDDQINSLQTQKAFFEEYSLKNGHNLVRIYADEGISGTKIKNRKEFLRLLEDAKLGLFEMVVVKDISRFARNTVDLLESTRKLKSLNIETMFLTTNMSVLGNSEFVLTIFGALAQEESANTSKRIKFGKKLNAKKGRVPNIVFGYDKIKGDYFSLEINEPEANTVRRIFDLYVNQGFGCNKIAVILNEQGIRTKRNNKFTQASVARILKNPIYTGIVVNGRQEVIDFLTSERKNNDETQWHIVENPDLKIIGKDLFEEASKILNQRQKDFNINKTRQSNKYVFSTLIKCKHCGYSFRRFQRTYKNTYTYWVCSGRNAKGMDSCPNNRSVYEEDFLADIKRLLSKILSRQDDILEKMQREYINSLNSKLKKSDVATLKAKIKKQNAFKQKYMDMYANDIISIAELKEKTGVINKEIASIQKQIKQLENSENEREVILSKAKNTFSNINSVLRATTITNQMLKSCLDSIVIDKDGGVLLELKNINDIEISI